MKVARTVWEGCRGATLYGYPTMRFTDILDATLRLYRKHFGLFFRIAAVYYVLAIGIELLLAVLVEGLYVPRPRFTRKVYTYFDHFLGCFVFTGCLAASLQTYLGREVTGRTALYRVLHRFLPCCYGWLFVLFTGAVWNAFSSGTISLIVFFNLMRFDSYLDPTRTIAWMVGSFLLSLCAIYF